MTYDGWRGKRKEMKSRCVRAEYFSKWDEHLRLLHRVPSILENNVESNTQKGSATPIGKLEYVPPLV